MSSAHGCGSGCREGLGSHQQAGDPRRTCSQRERREEGGALTEYLRSRELREETGPQKQGGLWSGREGASAPGDNAGGDPWGF